MAVSTESTDRSTNQLVLRRSVVGARRLSNYVWATIVSMGATGFFLASLSSYFGVNLLPLANSANFNPTDLIFIPQGVAMGFYGIAGLALASYLWLTMLWNVGGGYNQFDKETGTFQIVRQGFPGKNRHIEISQPLSDIRTVKVQIKEGLNPKRALYLQVKGRSDIPLTRVGQPLPLSDLENQAAELARFLRVPLEGI